MQAASEMARAEWVSAVQEVVLLSNGGIGGIGGMEGLMMITMRMKALTLMMMRGRRKRKVVGEVVMMGIEGRMEGGVPFWRGRWGFIWRVI